MVGTVRRNKTCLPPMISSANSQVKYSSHFLYNKENGILLVSYKPKDKNKLVLLISSYHRDKNVSDDVKRKPEVIVFYNKTKTGVDSLDQLVGSSIHLNRLIFACKITSLGKYSCN